LRSLRLQDSGLTRLAGGFQLAFVFRVDFRLRMGCTFFRTSSCFAELKGLFSLLSQDEYAKLIRRCNHEAQNAIEALQLEMLALTPQQSKSGGISFVMAISKWC
jgi:hypothetical protein